MRQIVCAARAESDISGNEQHPLKLYHHILLSLSHFDTTVNPGIGVKTGFLKQLGKDNSKKCLDISHAVIFFVAERVSVVF